MLFNSIDFVVFLPIVFILYWFVTNKNLKLQNFLIVAASYLFYGWWDWRYLILIAFTSLCSWVSGFLVYKHRNILTFDSQSACAFPDEKACTSLNSQMINKNCKAKLYLCLNIIINLVILGFYKYFNFFVQSFIDAFTLFGITFHATTLQIILPIGISFYTFQALSYSIDIYRGKLEPTHDIVAFFAYVAFFPQLVAGPIERATHLLPQFYTKRFFDYAKAVDGMRQILWGLFKKIVIADNCAEYANLIFNNSSDYSGSTLVLGAFFFTFQIYGDFSGYSDIAIGVSRLFGFNLMQNFNFPYFSRDIAEFWRRWHISLTTWFRDYLYIPLGGSRGSLALKIRNTFIIFLVSGFWHGANWTFLAWGALNAIYFLPLLLTNNNRNHLDTVAKERVFPSLKEFLLMALTFGLTVFAWIFFRADNIHHAISYITEIFSFSLFSIPKYIGIDESLVTILLVAVFVLMEWHGRKSQYAIEHLGLTWKRPLRYALYMVIIIALFWFGGKEQQFIYFQF